MKKYLIIILLLLLIISGCSSREQPSEMAPDADPDKIPNLGGEYAVNGFDPSGQEYGGRLTIMADGKPNFYKMQWIVVGSIQEGVGILKGNQLLVDWQTIEGSSSQSKGTAIYTVTEAGELYGTRMVDGFLKEGVEQAFPNQ